MTPDLYYGVRPFIPRRVQVLIRRIRVDRQRAHNDHWWPVWEQAGTPPPAWRGWPGGKTFALVLTHDVEQASGLAGTGFLAALEEKRGFRSAFNFVPLRYNTPDVLRRSLAERGFEVNLHGLRHDGKDFRSRRLFNERSAIMRSFLRHWGSSGFSSPSSLHNLPWISELNIDFDVSTFDVDPFEPQPCHFCRIFPFWVQRPDLGAHGFVEIPNTLPQDFTLFVLMRERSNEIWRRKLDWIAGKGGLAVIKTHPDYISFGDTHARMDRYPVHFYTDFLDYVRQRYGDRVWLAKPSEVARYWRELRPPAGANGLAFRDTYCESCRRAHRDGWFHNYRPDTGR